MLNFYAEYLISLLQYRAIGQLWDRLFLVLLYRDYTDIVQGKASRDMSKILSDSQIVGAMIGSVVPSIVINIVRLVGILAFMLYINYQLTLIAVLSLIPYYLVYKRISPSLVEASASEREAFERAFENLREKVEGLTTIKKLGIPEYFYRTFLTQVEKWITAMKRLILRERFYYFSTDAISSIMPVVILIIGALMVQRNLVALSVGSLLAFMRLSSGIYEPVSNLSNNFAALSKGAPALSRVKSVLSVSEKREKGTLFDERIIHIRVVGGTKIGYSFPILTIDEELSFKKGDKVIVSGDSGSGKSTLVLSLAGLLRIFSGDILINGKSVTRYNQDSILSRISIVGPDEALFKGTLLENITLGRNVPKQILEKIVRICKLDLPLNFVIEAGGKNVSYGQRQRISLARALAKNPDVLILDEALSGIQLRMEEEILENLLAEYPNTIIFLYIAQET
ncbi:MAG: ATP-binding cassette, subfamily bacterial [Pyrococcus sp.]|uniref:ATP-binding cassette domain-containing protein n=1 Tax=Pyrococcus sp. TaxID=33866 RepID=UPI00258FEE99|nr:ABC transporter ATP-binding protein [Pyrococcus sp.]MDK2869778.1 ATP-binding cassette, subfamily bacterial [Pyrococcus sp.]